MKRTIPLTRQSAWFLRLAVFLVIIACASEGLPALFITHFEYDFNISVYRICIPAEIDAADENEVNNKCFSPWNLFNRISICLVGQGKWAWKPGDAGPGFLLPLTEYAGVQVQMLQFSNVANGLRKSRQDYNFKVMVHDTGADQENDHQGKLLLQKEMIYPGRSANVWNFTLSGKTLFFIVVETTKREIAQEMPDYRFIIRTIPPYPPLASCIWCPSGN